MRVLVPYNGSRLSEKDAEHAHGRYDGAEIVLLHVLDLVSAGYEAPPEAALLGYRADRYGEAEESGGDDVRGGHGRLRRDVRDGDRRQVRVSVVFQAVDDLL
jgi:hypothetical protein